MKLASEGAMRKIAHDNMQLDMEAENVPMSFSQPESDEVKLAPLVQITDLKEAIFPMLDKHQRYCKRKDKIKTAHHNNYIYPF